MHKSSGNMIEFDEAADRMGVDVMRWMFAKSRPEDNILFGWHAADEARRELLILWNVYSFFVTYARLAGWSPTEAAPPVGERRASIAGSCRARRGRRHGRGAAARRTTRVALRARCRSYLDGLSTWYLRLSRRRFSRSDDPRDQDAAFATLHEALVAAARMLAPTLPFLAESLYANLVTDGHARRARQRPPDPLADRGAWRPSRRRAGALDGGRPGARSTLPGPCAAAPASRPASRSRRPGSPLPGSRPGDRRRAAPAHRRPRSTSRTVDRHRRRLVARRAAGQAAAAQDREAARVGDPRGDGRGRGRAR